LEQHANESTTSATDGYRFEMPVRWGDLDALNHVNNTVFFRYMEEARVRCFSIAGVGAPGSGRDFVLAHSACDFLRPILWPATVQIVMRLTRLGRSSLEHEAEIHVLGDSEGPCARARNIVVGISTETGRSAPWTPEEIQGITRTLGAPVA